MRSISIWMSEEFDNMVDAVMTDSYLAESDGPDPYGIDIERMLLNGNDNYYGPRSLLLPTLHPAPPPLQDFQDALEGLSDEEFNEVERELQRRQRLRQSGDLVDRFQRQTQIRSDVNNNPETNNSIPRRPTIRRNQTRPFLAPGITRSSDAQFNRLLLSSARQSYLNPNPNPRYSINDVSYRASASSSSSAAASGSGESARSRDEIRPIPLRRQNAIRLRSANPYFDELSKSVVINDSRVFDKKDKSDNKSITNNDNDNNNKDNDNNDSKDNIEEDDEKTDCSWKSEINLEARKLHRDMTDYLIRSKNLKSFRNRGGKSLLFPLSEFEPNYAYFFLPSSHSLRNEGATYNLELDMDVYLKRRRLDLLWLKLAEDCKPEPRFNACVSYGKRKFPKPLIPNEGGVLKRQKIDHNGSDGEEVEFLNDDLPKKVKSKIYNPSMKSKKGHKKTHLLLSREDKEKIMNVQFSSYFQSGVRYRILLDHYKPSITECDLVFSNIDYEQNSIQGCFQFQDFNPMSNDPYSSLRKQLEMFAKYFCGIEKDFYWNNFIKSDNIRRKLNILDKLLKDKNVHQSIANNCQVQKLISIPVEGEIIDFKTHDLRFLPSLKLPDNKSYANRHSRQSSQSPANKLKSSRARVQVLEWMKLEPFQQFKQSCLLSYLQLVRRNLIHFSNLNIPVVDQGDARYLLDSFENNMNEIKEDFAYIKHQLSNSKGLLPGKTSTSSSAPPTPPIAVSGQMSRARAALPPPPPSKLKNSDDWEKTLARKLCESITDDDSISLLNVQLNYVLFTLKVDVSKYLDICINFFLENCHDDKKSYISKYKMVHDKILKDESKEKVVDDNKFATLLCSINRKSGLLEIHNTLPYLHYKDINPKHSSQVLSRVMGIGSSGRVQSDFEMFSLADREGLPRSFGDLPKDLNHHLPAKSSKLTGTLKRDYSSHEVGSGHSSFQMV
ncbi:hypothetical protein DFJ63DRAFT_104558 [Scheffersomyces coipomensis]|uniref:uncharacterized protein n=1 Tax=Scheffersomyces coipomensis TaxID=1788519 RepID=UPI00315C77FA